jgi:predicted nucleic acid-binding protein
MLVASTLGEWVTNALIAESAHAYVSDVNLAEAEYVLCRKLGPDESRSKIDNLRNSNYVTVADCEQVSRLAAQIKCKRSISFADCFCLATGEATASKPLFAFKEKELQREIKRRGSELEITFLEDLAKGTQRFGGPSSF